MKKLVMLAAFALTACGYECKRYEPGLCADTKVIEYVCPDAGECTWQPRANPCDVCTEWEKPE